MSPVWQSLSMLHLLWLLPIFWLLYFYAGQARQRALQQFAQPSMIERLLSQVSLVRRRWKHVLWLTAMTCLILALARPCWNPVTQEIKRQGRDVVFVLDVSRSMLADDLKPNRLERAKLAINDCLDVLEGDRVGLLVFAGNSLLRCPLTLDYGFFRMMLADVDTTTVSRGGTRIGDALRKVMNEVFDDQHRQFKDVVLITDGEDHDTFPVEAAQKLGDKGARLLAIGLGDEHHGTPIMITDEHGQKKFLHSEGEIVRSRLDADTLREMVAKTPGGKYLPVGTGNFDLGQIYLNLIATADKRELEAQTLERYEEKFQVFLSLTLVLLLAEGMIGERKRKTA